MDNLQLKRFEFLKSFVTVYGFHSLHDFTTEISIKKLKQNKTFLTEVNNHMDTIRSLFPMSLFNLKRKDYCIDTENLAIKVLRKCLECTNITYEHIHKQNGNVLRLNLPNLFYMKYILQNMNMHEMNDLVHGLDWLMINQIFNNKEISILDFKKKVCYLDPQSKPTRLTRKDLLLSNETKILTLNNSTSSRRINLFDHLNEFCVINSIKIHHMTQSKDDIYDRHIELMNMGHNLVCIKSYQEITDLTKEICSYEYPLPLAAFPNKNLFVNIHVSSQKINEVHVHDKIVIDYTEMTTIDLEQFKKLFCQNLVIPIHQTCSDLIDLDDAHVQVYCNSDVISHLKCIIYNNINKVITHPIEQIDLCLDNIVVNTSKCDSDGVCVFDFDGKILSIKHAKLSFVVHPQSSLNLEKNTHMIIQYSYPIDIESLPNTTNINITK